MSEAPVTDAKVEETTETTPPWERDGETFDPERAWKLVQNLKAELASVKAKQAEAPEPAAEEPAPEPEAKPAEVEAPEPQDDATAQIASLQAELARVKALATVGLSQDFAPFVPGATSEEIEANLATLQKLISDAAMRRLRRSSQRHRRAEAWRRTTHTFVEALR